jgi:hypothetical protein
LTKLAIGSKLETALQKGGRMLTRKDKVKVLLYQIFKNKRLFAEREKELMYLLNNDPDCKKLLVYARSLGINIEDGMKFNTFGWTAWKDRPLITINVGIARKSIRDDDAKYSLAHELGHKEHDQDPSQKLCPHRFSMHDCVYEEWAAWIRGLKILEKLEISVDYKEFWQRAFKALDSHYRSKYNCPQFSQGQCPKLSEIKQFEKIREK